MARGTLFTLVLKYLAYSPSLAPIAACEGLTSSTSGARESPLSDRTASFSAADEASGLAFVIGMPNFLEKVFMISP